MKNNKYKSDSNLLMLIKNFAYKLGLILLPLNYTLILIKSDLDKLGWVANHTRRSVPYSITKCLCLIKPIANSIACLHNRRNTIVFFGAR